MAKEWTAPELLGLSGAYWEGAALQAAVRLDLFSALAKEDRPLDASFLAGRLACDERALGMLLTALTALGFLEKTPTGFSAPPAVIRLLSRQSPDYQGFIITHHADIMPAWAELADAVRTGAPTRTSSSHTESEEEREAFLMGMFNVAKGQADAVAAALDLSGRSRLIDIGGGPGTYAVFFCQRNPNLKATIFDLPTTRRFAEGTVKRFDLESRIVFHAGDFLKDGLPKGHDVAWLSQVLHGENPEDAARLVKNAASCLVSGGLLCIQEFVLNDEGTGPAHASLFNLNMLVGTEGGQAYSKKELTTMLTEAGAGNIRTLDVALPNDCRILLGEVK
ncbi:SAM-dependent methyltransferase [Alphaproteobacteria bacterium]|nr:SAM-dependent methyltransferase [Alphaproteobacteria bacterium]